MNTWNAPVYFCTMVFSWVTIHKTCPILFPFISFPLLSFFSLPVWLLFFFCFVLQIKWDRMCSYIFWLNLIGEAGESVLVSLTCVWQECGGCLAKHREQFNLSMQPLMDFPDVTQRVNYITHLPSSPTACQVHHGNGKITESRNRTHPPTARAAWIL